MVTVSLAINPKKAMCFARCYTHTTCFYYERRRRRSSTEKKTTTMTIKRWREVEKLWARKNVGVCRCCVFVSVSVCVCLYWKGNKYRVADLKKNTQNFPEFWVAQKITTTKYTGCPTSFRSTDYTQEFFCCVVLLVYRLDNKQWLVCFCNANEFFDLQQRHNFYIKICILFS